MGRKRKLLSELSEKRLKSKVAKKGLKSKIFDNSFQIDLNNSTISKESKSDKIQHTERNIFSFYNNEASNFENSCQIIEFPLSDNSVLPSKIIINDSDPVNSDFQISNGFLFRDQNIKISDRTETDRIIRGLRIIAIKKKLPCTALNDILKLLKPILPNLPIDYRTILNTPRNTKVKIVTPGKYIHFGLESGLIFKIKQLRLKDLELKLDFFIDGVSMHPSSKNKTFWIILARIHEVKNSIIPIGLYNGPRKADDFDELLSSFIFELKNILDKKIEFDGNEVKVEMNNYCLDTPARASTLGIIGHSGYKSCVRCLCEGSREEGRMLFKYVDSNKRTDEMFKNRNDQRFHVRDSLIEKELNIKMVSQFPLDFLHVVCLGTVRKIFIRLVGPNKPMFPKSRAKIDEILEKINETLPSEIHRSLRDIKDVSTFKGHEWRLILLKLSPVLFKPTIPRKIYEHFLLLTCSFSILCDPDNCIKFNRIAHSMLNKFNDELGELYDDSVYVPMVHQCIHFADEVLNQKKPCDKFSTWDFESYMTPLKDLIQGPRLPLSQIYRRITEYFTCFDNDESKSVTIKNGKNFLYYEGIRIETKSCKDSFFLTKHKEVIVILKIIDFKKKQFVCRKLKMLNDFFTKPIAATKLNFYHTSTQYSSDKFIIDIFEIERKLLCITTEENNHFYAPISKFSHY
jgi:hypothetical protein